MFSAAHIEIPGIVSDFNLTLEPGQRVALIGESGSGKTMTALALMQFIRHQGRTELGGTHLESLSQRQLNKVRGQRIAMIFQEPMNALDPTMRIGRQLSEVLRNHGKLSHSDQTTRTAELLTQVGLPPEFSRRYPHELSGGQRQRVLIAMALAWNPEVLICDEPTTALDATAQRAVLDLLRQLVEEHNIALIFISHDLNVVAHMCTDALVLQKGRVVEHNTVDNILQRPEHEYTRQLVRAATHPLLPDAPSAQGRTPEHGEDIVVSAEAVSHEYTPGHGIFDVNLQVRAGERIGIVGGSGSGKTTLLRLIAGMISPTGGTLHTNGTSRMVFQDPLSSFNPRMRLAAILQESAPEVDVARSLAEVGIEHTPRAFPHELSGGQRQRLAIARALAAEPQILLADEPVSALDMTVRANILSLIDEMVHRHNTTFFMVSHDLAVVQAVCDRIFVVDQGHIVEEGSTQEIFTNPQHPVTKELLAAIPELVTTPADSGA